MSAAVGRGGGQHCSSWGCKWCEQRPGGAVPRTLALAPSAQQRWRKEVQLCEQPWGQLPGAVEPPMRGQLQ
jgi:hypothetical protein